MGQVFLKYFQPQNTRIFVNLVQKCQPCCAPLTRRGRVDSCSASHYGGRGSIFSRSKMGFLSGDTTLGVFLGVLPFPQFTPIPSSYHLTPLIILTPSVMSQAAGTNKKMAKSCNCELYPLGLMNK